MKNTNHLPEFGSNTSDPFQSDWVVGYFDIISKLIPMQTKLKAVSALQVCKMHLQSVHVI